MTRHAVIRAARTALVWSGRCWRYTAPVVIVLAGALSGHHWRTALVLLVLLSPFAGLGWWSVRWPAMYDRTVAAWWTRRTWRRYFARRWDALCDAAGWTGTDPTTGEPTTRPRLLSVEVTGAGVALVVTARHGQHAADLIAGAEPLGAAMGAASVRATPVPGHMGRARLSIVTGDRLAAARDALPVVAVPDPAGVAVPLGRTEDGAAWRLPVTGRHTLVVGCSGAGKGSVLWGVVGGLAPAVEDGRVVLWGIDLKRGVEVETGGALFAARAYTTTDALAVLRALLDVLDRRGRTMAGVTRQHVPTPAEPLHVLVVDELAALTAYAPRDVRTEAGALLAEVLTQGRALGVSVVACVQDPRKETVPARGLFTQTVALRLRSRDEVSMVLGAGTADLAPADRIPAATPGVGYVVTDDGAVTRVRADYWPDALIRATAARHPAPSRIDLTSEPEPVAEVVPEPEPVPASGTSTEQPAPARRRQPKQPRRPRTPAPDPEPDAPEA